MRSDVTQKQLWCELLLPCLESTLIDEHPGWTDFVLPRLVHHLTSYDLALRESALRVLYSRLTSDKVATGSNNSYMSKRQFHTALGQALAFHSSAS